MEKYEARIMSLPSSKLNERKLSDEETLKLVGRFYLRERERERKREGERERERGRETNEEIEMDWTEN